MLIGEYHHTLDPKKRLAIPAKLRKEIGDRAVLTKGLDSCLFLFSRREWGPMADTVSTMPIGQREGRGLARFLLAGASEVDLDQLGRVLVPDYLRDHAGLQKAVVIVGVGNRLEIWDKDRWQSYKKDLEQNSDAYASSFTGSH